MATPDAGSTEPVFAGEACTMGDVAACTCADGGEGEKSCRADPASPTGGAFGECTNCVAPVMMEPDAGGSTAGTAGMAADPGMGTGGGQQDPNMRTCDVNACPDPVSPIPALPPPMKCCTDQGTCGEIDLFMNCV